MFFGFSRRAQQDSGQHRFFAGRDALLEKGGVVVQMSVPTVVNLKIAGGANMPYRTQYARCAE